MKRTALSLLLLATTAHALPPCVVVVGDSISAPLASLYPPHASHPGLPDTAWPTLLAEEIGVDVCNLSVAGRTTVQAIASFDADIDALQAIYEINDVIFLLGINNFVIPRTPSDTVADLRAMAAKTQAQGARPWTMTLTPANPISGTHNFTNVTSNWLQNKNGAGPVYPAPDLRDVFTLTNWPACATDKIHPSGDVGLPCREAIADFVASWVPAQ